MVFVEPLPLGKGILYQECSRCSCCNPFREALHNQRMWPGFRDCAVEQSHLFPGLGCMTGYQYEAASLEGFIQQLAVQYLARGYYFFVSGRVPAGKDPQAVDDKLLRKYCIQVSKWARARRKKAGQANVHYLRFDRFFVLVSTHGEHPFFEEEPFRDARETPIRFGGYSVSFRGGHAHVRIEKDTYLELKAFFEDIALRGASQVGRALASLPFEAYAPIRRQLLSLLGSVNRKRRAAGLDPLPWSVLRLKRRNVKVFAHAPPRNAQFARVA